MMASAPFIITALLLFGIGLAGVILRRNGLAAVIALQICFSGCYLALAAFAATRPTPLPPILLLIAAGAAQAVIALITVVNLRRRTRSMDVSEASELKW